MNDLTDKVYVIYDNEESDPLGPFENIAAAREGAQQDWLKEDEGYFSIYSLILLDQGKLHGVPDEELNSIRDSDYYPDGFYTDDRVDRE